MSHARSIERPFLTVKEAAAELLMGRQFVYERIADGSLPHYRRGWKILIDRKEFEEWRAKRVIP